jgi:hypothetical protein
MDANTAWTALGAIGAIAAAGIAWSALHTANRGIALASASLDEARRARRVHLSIELSERYSSEAMHKALVFLRAKANEAAGDMSAMAKAYVAKVRATPPGQVCEWDLARRRVSKFFVTASALCETGLLEEAVLAQQLQRAAFDMCVDVVSVLDRAHSEGVLARADYEPRAHRFFTEFRRRHFSH